MGLRVMGAWGFRYKCNIVWHKVRKDGGSDGRGVGFYFRNVTELLLFGVRGKDARTLAAGRRQVNLIATRKREHSRKPDELYNDRGLQLGASPRNVQPREAARLDRLGQPGERATSRPGTPTATTARWRSRRNNYPEYALPS